MLDEVYVQKRKWGFFGWVFMLLFVAWNAVMLLWMVQHIMVGLETGELAIEWERRVAEIGTDAGVLTALRVWTFGSVITGLLAFLTRSRKSIITRRN